ncbi:MAG: hypothetical protein Tsb009_18570 [Planctomycetaceae bacterium]
MAKEAAGSLREPKVQRESAARVRELPESREQVDALRQFPVQWDLQAIPWEWNRQPHIPDSKSFPASKLLRNYGSDTGGPGIP